MKLSFKQKNALRLGILILILVAILIFIYYELKSDDKHSMNISDLGKELSSNEKNNIVNKVNEAGGTKLQQFAANGALKNDGKISFNEAVKIQALGN